MFIIQFRLFSMIWNTSENNLMYNDSLNHLHRTTVLDQYGATMNF